MRLSRREQQLVNLIRRYAGQEFEFSEVVANYVPRKEVRHLKTALFVSMRKLRDKLKPQGILLERRSAIGRGHKARFFVSQEIEKL